jgi:ribosome-binding protein aMBF1 (putative translation factor)
MSLLQNNLSRIIVSLFPLFIIVTFCKQSEKPEISSQSASRDSTQTNVQELMLTNQSESDIEENINSLMKLIKEKEAELKKARQEMKLKSVELAQKVNSSVWSPISFWWSAWF